MPQQAYRICRKIGRIIEHQCLRKHVLYPERASIDGPVIFAPTHLSHLEPFLVGIHLKRRVHMLARIEFYQYRLARFLLNQVDCIPINRFGVPVRAIRKAIALLDQGEAIGIFPEGGVRVGGNSVMRGGKIKQGVCLLAHRARAPVVPVVVLGADKLNCVSPWLPFRRGRIWMAFGEAVRSDPLLHRRAARMEMAMRLEKAYIELYQQLLVSAGLQDSKMP